MTGPSRLLCLACIPFTMACGEDAERYAAGEPQAMPIPGCAALDPAPCDVRESECQVRRLELTACARGDELPGDLPPVALWSRTEYADYLNAWFEENPPPAPNHWESALVLLGLAEPGALSVTTSVSEQVENTAAFYRIEEKDIVIVDHGEPLDDAEANAVLTHEFVHLLQDREVDLAGYREAHIDSYDSFLANDAVTEGEARMIQDRVRASLLGLDVESIDFTKRFNELIELNEAWVFEQPTPFTASYGVVPYWFGARYVNFAWQAGGHESVLALFANPPDSTKTLMESVGDLAPPGPTLEFTDPVPPDGTEFYTRSELGAWGLYLVLANHLPRGVAREKALTWRGDALRVFVPPESPVPVLVWSVEVEDTEVRTSLDDWLRSKDPLGVRRVVAVESATGITLAVTDSLEGDLTWAVIGQ